MIVSEEAGMTERDIIRVLSGNHSAGTEAFRDALLARCLAVIGSNEPIGSPDGESGDLDDEELGMLAAAGTGTPQRSAATTTTTCV